LTRKHWQSLTIWATSDWAIVVASENQTSPPRATEYSPREGWLAFGSRDGAFTLRSLSKDGAKVLKTFQKLVFDTPVNVMQFSPDGRTLVFGNADGTIKVLEYQLPIPRPGYSVVSLEPVPMPQPMPLVVPEVSIPVPSITADFNNPASTPGVVVFLVVVGAIAFIWFRARHTTSPIQEVNEPLPKNQEHRPLSKNRGYVYLLKAGPYYKVGRSKDFNKRIKAIRLQLPFDTEQVHVVETSDMIKLENQWHGRFKEKRENGEWFLLSEADVWEFKQQ